MGKFFNNHHGNFNHGMNHVAAEAVAEVAETTTEKVVEETANVATKSNWVKTAGNAIVGGTKKVWDKKLGKFVIIGTVIISTGAIVDKLTGGHVMKFITKPFRKKKEQVTEAAQENANTSKKENTNDFEDTK